MGELQGSSWTTLVYFLMIGMFFSFIIMGMEITNFWGGVNKIEDGLKEFDYEVFEEIPRKFRPCSDKDLNLSTGFYDTTHSCSGVTGVDYIEGVVTYQLEFNGMYLKLDATKPTDLNINISY